MIQYISLIIATISIIGSAVSVGIIFGSLKGKVQELSNLLANRRKYNDHSIDNIHGDVHALYNKTDDIIERNQNLKNYIDDKLERNRNYMETNVKDLSDSIKDIQKTCAVRKQKVDLIPDLNEKIRQLEIEVGVLPTKLSEELSKAFSDEYKKIINKLSSGETKENLYYK